MSNARGEDGAATRGMRGQGAEPAAAGGEGGPAARGRWSQPIVVAAGLVILAAGVTLVGVESCAPSPVAQQQPAPATPTTSGRTAPTPPLPTQPTQPTQPTPVLPPPPT